MVVKRRDADCAPEMETPMRTSRRTRGASRVTQSFYFSHCLPCDHECKREKEQEAGDLGQRRIVVEVGEPLPELLRGIDRPEPQVGLRPVVAADEQRKQNAGDRSTGDQPR